jgi:hypothetical protein
MIHGLVAEIPPADRFHPARAITNRRPRRWCICRPLSLQSIKLSALS